jgi:hypothetical protein
MPNWCHNNMTVSGKPDEVSRFVAHAKGRGINEGLELDFNQFIPMPDELRFTEASFGGTDEQKQEREKRYAENKAKHGYDNWYDWANEEWGTKWNAHTVDDTCFQTLNNGDMCATFLFETAWSPPMPVYHKMSEMFPTLEFDLELTEESDEFDFNVVLVNGIRIREHDNKLDREPEDEESEDKS